MIDLKRSRLSDKNVFVLNQRRVYEEKFTNEAKLIGTLINWNLNIPNDGNIKMQ